MWMDNPLTFGANEKFSISRTHSNWKRSHTDAIWARRPVGTGCGEGGNAVYGESGGIGMIMPYIRWAWIEILDTQYWYCWFSSAYKLEITKVFQNISHFVGHSISGTNKVPYPRFLHSLSPFSSFHLSINPFNKYVQFWAITEATFKKDRSHGSISMNIQFH